MADRPELTIDDVDPQGVDALALLREAATEAAALYPQFHDPRSPGPVNAPTPPGGVYLVARRGGEAVGCGALRPLGAGAAALGDGAVGAW